MTWISEPTRHDMLPNDDGAHWTVRCHMPGLVLEEREALPFAEVGLESIGFEAWDALDGDYHQPVDYNDSKPVFFVAPLGGEKPDFTTGRGPRFEDFARLRTDIYRSLLLVSGAALPPPRLSCAYFSFGDGPFSDAQIVGSSGREWILGGHFRGPRWSINKDSARHGGKILNLLRQTGDLITGTPLLAGIEALELTALPDTTANLDGSGDLILPFVNCIAAAERILLPEPGSDPQSSASLTEEFGRHLAVIIAYEFDNLDATASSCIGIYRTRSDLMHGRAGSEGIEDETKARLELGRPLLCLLIRRLLAILAERNSPLDIPAALAHAYRDRTAHAALWETIKRGGAE